MISTEKLLKENKENINQIENVTDIEEIFEDNEKQYSNEGGKLARKSNCHFIITVLVLY